MKLRFHFLLAVCWCCSASFVLSSDRHHPRIRRRASGQQQGTRHFESDVPCTSFYDEDAKDEDEDAAFWMGQGEDELLSAMGTVAKEYSDHAKNVIIFIGDGMSVPTVTAARIYKAQMEEGNCASPESKFLTFERLDHMGHSLTYDVDIQVGDSAATGNAIFSGVKTRHGTFGFDSHVRRGRPETMDPAYEVTTIMSWAQDSGMDTGLVSTARMSHATPASLYAHSFDRDYECDSKFNETNDSGEPLPDGYGDVAWQLINRSPGNKAKVLLAGGFKAFLPQDKIDELLDELGPYSDQWFDCYREDGVDLTEEWLAQKKAEGHGNSSSVVFTAADLREVDPTSTEYLMGLFAEGHMEYDHARQADRDPSISEMTEKAMRILSKGDNGFFLMVEGGTIDQAHHNVWARKAISETVALDHAVSTAIVVLSELGELEETLIIVTADHSHTMSIAGYSDRGASIVGLNDELYDDDLPYTTLSYANGLSFYDRNLNGEGGQITRQDLTEVDVQSFEYTQTSAGPRGQETHGGDDVAIYASGPRAQLFHRSHEQTHIANVMAYAACIGPYRGVTDGNQICVDRAVDGDTEGSNGSLRVESSTHTLAWLAVWVATKIFSSS